MASKIFALCALVCAIQGLNGAIIRPSVFPVESVESDLLDQSLSHFKDLQEEYAGMIDSFENIVLDAEAQAPEAEFAGFFDSILESIGSLDGIDASQNDVDMEIVRKCIEEQRPNFEKFIEHMRVMVADARVQLRQFIFDTFTPFIERARKAFHILAAEIAQFPMRMWECIKEHNFLKVLEVIQKTGRVVKEQANEIASSIRDARAKFPAIKEKAHQLRDQIRKEAKAGMGVIREAVKQCIANGGPKLLFPVPVGPVATFAPEQVSSLIAPADAVYEA